MSESCIDCKTQIDTANDEHYSCSFHPEIIRCSSCYGKNGNCPVCGRRLQHHSDSWTKRVFSPFWERNMLGF